MKYNDYELVYMIKENEEALEYLLKKYEPLFKKLAFSFAFKYKNPIGEYKDTKDPFVYQNQLFSQLLGEETLLYIPLEFQRVQEGDIELGNPLNYNIKLIGEDYVYYGNLPWKSYCESIMNVNDYYLTGYSRWLSPSVFHIPASGEESYATVSLTSQKSYAYKEDQAQFYALDLNKLKEVTDILMCQQVDVLDIENGNANIVVTAGVGERLFLSIPYDVK